MSQRIATSENPQFASGLANIASLFDPKSAAEGAALLARTKNFDAETRYNAARASAVEDQNSVLTDQALLAAGITDPIERAAYRAARTNSVNDWFAGRNRNTGGKMITTKGATEDDIRKGALVLGITSAGRPDFAGSSERADNLLNKDNESKLARLVAGKTIEAQSRIAAAGMKGGSGRTDPNTQPFVSRDPAGDVSRLYGTTDSDGKWIPPSEEDVVQPIMNRAQAFLSAGLATRDNAIQLAIASLGWLPKKEVLKEESGIPFFGSEKDVVQPRPAKAPEMVDPSLADDGSDTGEVINVPESALRNIKDPNGPFMNAQEGTTFVIGNIAYRRVPGGLQRVR